VVDKGNEFVSPASGASFDVPGDSIFAKVILNEGKGKPPLDFVVTIISDGGEGLKPGHFLAVLRTMIAKVNKESGIPQDPGITTGEGIAEMDALIGAELQ
jgi:hypothetical protein